MKNRFPISATALWILALGFVVRLYASQNTFIINSDGVIYIHQARALYYGQWDSLFSCSSIGYLSSYPFLIALAYPLFGDWLTAAKTVSLFFGTLTLVPILFLLKRFFRDRICELGLLVFALIPVFVIVSADVLRGPAYWFFLSLGLCLFAAPKEEKKGGRLFFAGASFLAAAWARAEAFLAIPVSLVFILLSRERGRAKRAFALALPAILALAAIQIGGVRYDFAPADFFRIDEFSQKLSAPFAEYRDLREQLETLSKKEGYTQMGRFLEKARTSVWLTALGTFANSALEAFFYPLLPIFAIGFAVSGRKFSLDSPELYFLLLAAGGAILLYAHTLQFWILEKRFMPILILPCALFAGHGLERIVGWVRGRFGWKDSAAVLSMCVLILAVSVPKCLRPREEDKAVFKEIARAAACGAGGETVVRTATPPRFQRWISFYGNLDYPGAPCPDQLKHFLEDVSDDREKFVRKMEQQKVHFFLWAEKYWPPDGFDVSTLTRGREFEEVGRWRHRDTGQMILFCSPAAAAAHERAQAPKEKGAGG